MMENAHLPPWLPYGLVLDSRWSLLALPHWKPLAKNGPPGLDGKHCLNWWVFKRETEEGREWFALLHGDPPDSCPADSCLSLAPICIRRDWQVILTAHPEKPSGEKLRFSLPSSDTLRVTQDISQFLDDCRRRLHRHLGSLRAKEAEFPQVEALLTALYPDANSQPRKARTKRTLILTILQTPSLWPDASTSRTWYDVYSAICMYWQKYAHVRHRTGRDPLDAQFESDLLGGTHTQRRAEALKRCLERIGDHDD